MESSADSCQPIQDYTLANSTGVELFCRRWKPGHTSPRAVVFLAHGFGEHIGYYEELATALVKESFYVFAHDHVGHGRSGGPRVHIDSVEEYIKDVITHFEAVDKEISADIPRFIVGHSMGGTIAIKTATCHPERFRGVVLVAPAVIASPELATPMRIFIVKIVSRFVPHFPVAPIDWNNVTRNKEMVEKYSRDNLCHQGKVKAKWAVALYNALQEINNNLTNVEWPFLVLHGSGDLITDISGSKLLFELASSKDKQIKIYEQASHNLLQELEDVRHSVIQEIVNWIVQRLSQPEKTSDPAIQKPEQKSEAMTEELENIESKADDQRTEAVMVEVKEVEVVASVYEVEGSSPLQIDKVTSVPEITSPSALPKEEMLLEPAIELLQSDHKTNEEKAKETTPPQEPQPMLEGEHSGPEPVCQSENVEMARASETQVAKETEEQSQVGEVKEAEGNQSATSANHSPSKMVEVYSHDN